MLNTIAMLERLGQDAQLRHATRGELAAALAGAEIDPTLRAALLAGDARRLEALVGAIANVCCMVRAPYDDEDIDEEGADP